MDASQYTQTDGQPDGQGPPGTLELARQRDRTRAILEAAGEAVVVTDAAGLIQYMNPAAVALTGSSAGEADAEEWSIQEDMGLLGSYEALMEEARSSGQICRGEAVYEKQDGTLCDLAVTVAALREPETGELAGFVSVARDITPIKAAQRVKDEFVSNVSHELRTPLSSITLLSANLDRLYEHLEEARRRRMIREIREQVMVFNDLVQDILETSLIDSQSISMERQVLNLADLVASEAGKQMPLAKQRRQTLHLTGAQELFIQGNEGQLKQVIRNVLSNAIKYTPEGGQIVCEGTILVTGKKEESRSRENRGREAPASDCWAALRVTDTGPGIGEQDLALVFDRFYRAKAVREIPGTGLGLSIAKELVELHGGELKVSSTLGKGSTFTILLPLDPRTGDNDRG